MLNSGLLLVIVIALLIESRLIEHDYDYEQEKEVSTSMKLAPSRVELALQRSHQVPHFFGFRSVPEDDVGIVRRGR